MFIRYISHEIRNPLNSVQLGLESLEEDMRRNKDSSSQLEIIQDVKASLQASITTLNDMLTSDKIRSGLLNLERKRVHLQTYLSSIIHRYQYQVIISYFYSPCANKAINTFLSDRTLWCNSFSQCY